ncbi:short-chain dehydrogenase [Parazoarcus communis]|uniref:Short-chain dehydrogenase n=1 Tax=Parazoarcus communis TaxID=41977 RepID=A0A2U8GP16_9RHOO|nr:SDR family oxidoreductase [Parazoarcus communis]AWI75264.1 short-chain dehydrogenase [Parazoarcus communis]
MRLLKKFVPGRVRNKLRSLRDGLAPRIPVTVPYEIRVADGCVLQNQVAIVTGGSGSIGRSIACCLAAEGAIVYVCGMSPDKINSVVTEIVGLGGKAYPQRLDVTDEADIVRTFAEVTARHGRLDIMVHSAGGSARDEYSSLIGQKTEVIDQVLNVNLRGAILCCREAAKAMVPSKTGRIINISSVLGVQGKANFAEYAASKGGVIAFTKSIAMELGPFGITANCVSPGIVQRGEISASELEQLSKTNWLSGYGKPEDIGEMVAYLASPRANFITGQNFIVDGGRSLGLKGD